MSSTRKRLGVLEEIADNRGAENGDRIAAVRALHTIGIAGVRKVGLNELRRRMRHQAQVLREELSADLCARVALRLETEGWA